MVNELKLKLTVRQAKFLWQLLKNLGDVTNDDSIARDARDILKRIEKVLPG